MLRSECPCSEQARHAARWRCQAASPSASRRCNGRSHVPPRCGCSGVGRGGVLGSSRRGAWSADNGSRDCEGCQSQGRSRCSFCRCSWVWWVADSYRRAWKRRATMAAGRPCPCSGWGDARNGPSRDCRYFWYLSCRWCTGGCGKRCPCFWCGSSLRGCRDPARSSHPTRLGVCWLSFVAKHP